MVALSAIAALGSAAAGAIGSAVQNKKAKDLLTKQEKDNRNWYQTKMSEDFTNRIDSQAVINRQRELLQEQADNAAGRSAVSGASPESSAIDKAQANNSLAQTMSDIAAQGATQKDKVEEEFRQRQANLDQQKAQIAANQAQAIAGAASQAVGSAITAGANDLAMGNVNPSAKDYAKANAINSAVANEGVGNMPQNPQAKLDSAIRNGIVNTKPQAILSAEEMQTKRALNKQNSIFKGIQ